MQDLQRSSRLGRLRIGTAGYSSWVSRRLGSLQALAHSSLALPILLWTAGIGLLFSSLWPKLLPLWGSRDGYYSHGYLVPFISAYVIYKRWPDLVGLHRRAGWTALPLLLGLMWVAFIARSMEIDALQSIAFVAVVLCSIWFVAGIHWMRGVSLPVLYLLFALPMWSRLIQDYTNPLQLISTKIAYQILATTGLGPMIFADEPTIIYLNNFALNVEIACSGLKLLLALVAFTCFFMMIAKLKWKGNLALGLLVVPLSMFMNGLRIAMVGTVGESLGHDAGIAFHDYSGYLVLLLCFFVIFRFARGLGWRN